MASTKEKRCAACGEVKPVSEFYEHKNQISGYATRCKPCYRSAYGYDPQRRKRQRQKDFIHTLWRLVKNRAEKAGIPFNLTRDDVQIPAFCPVLGIALTPGAPSNTPGLPSVDRIRPSLGYVRGNVKVISLQANTLKRDCTDPAVFQKIAAYLVANCRTP